MARNYSRKKGQSGSKKPFPRAKQSWVRYDAPTIEKLIVKYAKSGKTASEIGIILRDTYGIPDTRSFTGKKITQVLQEHKALGEIPEDLKALIKRGIAIVKHLETHKHDMPSLRGLTLTENKIKGLVRYYKNTGKLPATWMYERSKAKLLVG